MLIASGLDDNQMIRFTETQSHMSRPARHTQTFDQLIRLFTGPFSVRDLLEHIQAEGLPISRATTFRLLDRAVASGELVGVPHFGSERLYERSGPHHHHAICPKCERVRDAELGCVAHPVSEAILTLIMCQQCAAQTA